MGFSCHLCRKPFQEAEQMSRNGGGDGQVSKSATASATICGHLFHTKCLQEFFDQQSKNAWAPKTCPVCTKSLASLQDVIRVRAYPYDENSFPQRPAIEELQKQLKQAHQETADAIKRNEALQHEICELQKELDQKGEEFQTISLYCERLARMNKIHLSDLETSKYEIAKLKNMIIILTERLTVGVNEMSLQDSDVHSSNVLPLSNTSGAVVGLMQCGNDPSAGFPNPSMGGGGVSISGYELQIPTPNCNNNNLNLNFNSNGSQIKSSNLSHPPGLLHPYAMSPGNISEHASPSGGSENEISVSTNLQHRMATPMLIHEDPKLGFFQPARRLQPLGATPTLYGRAQTQQLLDIFPNPSAYPQAFVEDGRNYSGNKMIETSNEMITPSFSKISAIPPSTLTHTPVPTTDTSSASPPMHAMVNSGSTGNIEEKRCISRQFPTKDQPSKSKEMDQANNNTDALAHDEHKENENWHEKKSRRKVGSSRSGSSGGGTNRSSFTVNARMDDKRYGYFNCKTCHAEWGSSKSVLNQAQICRYCKTEVYPYKQDYILSRKQLELTKQEPSKSASKKK